MIHLAKEKPKNGKLIRIFSDGKVLVLESNKPFSELQLKKKVYIQMGYKANTLKVTYLDKDKKRNG